MDDSSIVGALHDAHASGVVVQRTVENYLSTIKRIKRLFVDNAVAAAAVAVSTYEVLTRPGVTYGVLLHAIDSYKTLEVTVAHVLGIMKHCGLRDTPQFCLWRGIYALLQEDVREARDSGVPTPRQEAGRLDWNAVMDTNERLKKELPPGSMDALLSAMYVDVPPRRQADYHRVFLLTLPEQEARALQEPAHIDLTVTPPRIHIRQFKTVRHQGAYEAPLPPAIVVVLRASLQRDPREYLFVQADGRPFERVASFTAYHNRALKRLFGPGVSNNSLRHALATHVNAAPRTLLERKSVAHAMGHAVVTNMQYALAAAPPLCDRPSPHPSRV